ncbi:MAG: polymer-forming cytoskeletal protein [Novosphingobium sp.]|uniref:bactofilin family protein n=1 Tax=Tsuneonella sp. CC-YZS046 TaxID=3042152 RepID=UPI002D7A15E2|nr:polymer-forming cytoskeletal protein [Tsuneonella sp. CC-YZS046]WRO65933.1 polymer-forming cytoskeletal protein [Tsuneonella sp. CC-YZS046]
MSGGTFSVIGPDVVIKGDIKASADLHVDGRIEGDISCSSLVQGESSAVTGAILAESARLAGRVQGSISASQLVVLRTARIEGDVFYDALTIEQGAEVTGRFAHRTSAEAAMPSAAAPAVEENGEEPRLSLAR